jgi:hypothetical protein
MLIEGFDPVPLLTRLNLEYRAMNLTMGGVANLLGVAFGVLDYDGYALEEGVRPAAEERRQREMMYCTAARHDRYDQPASPGRGASR